MSTDKKLTIVARYNEDISWTEKLPGDVVIYNKGGDFPYEIPRLDISNVGREAETYIHAIVDLYDELNNFDTICFLQGNPLDHCPDLFEILSKHYFLYFHENKLKFEPIIFLSHKSFQIECPKESFIFDSHSNIVDLYWEKIDKKSYQHITEQKISFQSENVKFDMYDMIYFLEIMNIPYKDKKIPWAYGAQYLVETKLILAKSKQWWIEFFNLAHYTLDVLESASFPYIMERLWPTIFYYGYKND